MFLTFFFPPAEASSLHLCRGPGGRASQFANKTCASSYAVRHPVGLNCWVGHRRAEPQDVVGVYRPCWFRQSAWTSEMMGSILTFEVSSSPDLLSNTKFLLKR